jgi:hypothetical protein
MTVYCRYCGNRRSDHPSTRCYGFVAQDRPTCRVCGGRFDPAKSGRSDCCYRHRLDS